MKVLYIGQNTIGTTSNMRAEIFQNFFGAKNFEIIDTNIPFHQSNHFSRSLAFRMKLGPAVSNINNFVQNKFSQLLKFKTFFDLIWIDKGLFLSDNSIRYIRRNSRTLVHYTPDMAFYENKSRKFIRTLPYYDYVITTKSSEYEYYLDRIPNEKLILTTQGYSKKIHYPRYDFEQKEDSVVFIGLAEPSRLNIINYLLESEIKVTLGGKGWNPILNKHLHNPRLKFLGDGIFSNEYAQSLSKAKFGLGLLSKKFPEYHTTRTFEIPACKTALLTEKNRETSSFFNEDEVIFYKNNQDLVDRIKYFINNSTELDRIIENGYDVVTKNGFDYQSIIYKILKKTISDN